MSSDSEIEEILEAHTIYRNPSWIMVKGNAEFQKEYRNELTIVKLQSFPYGLGIPNRDVEGIRWLSEKKVKIIITIENLTSFHQWELFQKMLDEGFKLEQECVSITYENVTF